MLRFAWIFMLIALPALAQTKTNQPGNVENPIPGPNWPPSELQFVGYQCQLGDQLINMTIDYVNVSVHEQFGDKRAPHKTGVSKPPTKNVKMNHRNDITYDTNDGRVHLELPAGIMSAGKIRRTNMDGETIEGRCWLFD